MALKGNLRDFTVTQLLNLINLVERVPAQIILKDQAFPFAAAPRRALEYS